MSRSRTAFLLLPLILAAAAAGYMVSRLLAVGPPQLVSGTVLPTPRMVPAFILTDQDGVAFDNARLAGQPSIMFFGFTHCPDICPTTLALMTQLVREPTLAGLQPVFVSVDPGRDDARSLRQYVNAFGGAFTGLRGEEEQLAPLLSGLAVAHGIVPLPGGGYTVDHSAAIYYLNDRGQWSAAFTPPFKPAELRQDLVTLIEGGY
jgi:protein SCO1/2